jgi:opacity protein-like surface antigen
VAVRKTNRLTIASALALCLLAPHMAEAQGGAGEHAGGIVGFGGMTIDASNSSPNLGGTLTFALTPHVHVVGEVGRLGNVLPSLSDALFSTAGVRASALYGEGGVRLLVAPRAIVSPYVEATAGVARIDVSTRSLGTIGDLVVPAALSFVPRTGPVAGAGGGVVLQAGRLMVDVGYRYKQLYPPTAIDVALGLGQELRSHQVRAGVGVRF